MKDSIVRCGASYTYKHWSLSLNGFIAIEEPKPGFPVLSKEELLYLLDECWRGKAAARSRSCREGQLLA